MVGNAVACDLAECDQWARADRRAGWIIMGVLNGAGVPDPNVQLFFCCLDHAGQCAISNSIQMSVDTMQRHDSE